MKARQFFNTQYNLFAIVVGANKIQSSEIHFNRLRIFMQIRSFINASKEVEPEWICYTLRVLYRVLRIRSMV